MSDFWFRVDVANVPRGVVVVEATETTRGLWQSLVKSILEGCAESLPRERWPQVVFLGDNVSHPLEAVLRGLGSRPDLGPGPATDISAQLGRGPFLGPSMSRYGETPPPMVLAISQARILDLPDWNVPEVTRSTLVYRLTGTDRLTPIDWHEVNAQESDFSVVPNTLDDPLTSIEVSCDGGIPIGWEPDWLEWSAGSVVGKAPKEPFRVGFVSESNPRPRARACRASQARIDLPMESVTPPDPTQDVALTGGEVTVLDNWASPNPRPYYCAACRPKEHAVGEIRCQSPKEAPLFPTLSRQSPGTLCELEKRSMGWTVRPQPYGVAILENSRVLVLRSPGRSPKIYTKVDEKWQPTAPPADRFWKTPSGRFLVVT